MLYVYAETQTVADRWARAQGVRPRDFRATGTRDRSTAGRRFRHDDRVVVLGAIDPKQHAVLRRNLAKSGRPPKIEYVPI